MTQDEINELFDRISCTYDKINNVISLGTHILIKQSSIKLLNLKENLKGADLCTGSGDLVKILQKIYPTCSIIGVDYSDKMLNLAKIKNPNNAFVKADCTKLPFLDNEFDFITMAFGLRNILNREGALKEIYRILKKGGLFLHLDFGKHNFLNSAFNFLVPNVWGVVDKNKKSYQYLINSKTNFPEPKELIEEFNSFGFQFLKRKDYIFGSISAQLFKTI